MALAIAIAFFSFFLFVCCVTEASAVVKWALDRKDRVRGLQSAVFYPVAVFDTRLVELRGYV